MSIKRTIITTIVALALVAVVAPVATQATTVSDLMAQIQALQAQLQGLSGSTTAGSVPAACVGVTFSRNLVVGSTGSDVKCLQVILNSNASTRVATTGAGSPGYETTTFGPRTLAAVRVWQVAAGFTPANQVGPMSRAKLNAWLGGAVVTPGNPNPVITSGPVSATVAPSNPPAGAIIKNQATAGLLDINFTGSGTVTSVTLQRSGISDQNTLTNVYLFDGNTRITDGYSFNISGQLVMNGLSIAVNGSHVISVRADVQAYSSGVTDSSIAVALTGFNGGAANVQGNTMNIVTGTAATAYLGANTVYTSGTTPAVNAGTTQYTVWSAPLQINTRAVMLKMANFKMVGSAPSNALANIRLFVDGGDTGKVATVTSINGSNYASFDLTSAPITLTTGSHTVDVRADVVSGASRTVQLSVQQASDLTITDPQVGVNIATLGASGASFTANVGANVNINQGSGSVVVDPAFTSTTNVSAGATNAVIGRFVIHGYGESVKVNSITVQAALSAKATTTTNCTTATTAQTITVGSTAGFVAGNAITSATTGVGVINSITGATTMNVTFSTAAGASDAITVADKGLNNVTLYFNGSQIGSTQSPTVSTTTMTFQLGSQMIIPEGQDSRLEVRADLQQQSTTTPYGAGTVIVTVGSGASANAQGQSSQNTFFVPGGTIAGSQATTGLSVSSATLVVSKNSSYTSQTATPNTAGVKIGSYIVQNQSTSESVRLTTLTVGLYSDAGATSALNTTATTSLAGLSSMRTSDTTGSGSTPIQPTASNTFSVNDTLVPGASMVIDIFADSHDAATLAAVSTRLTVASIGVTSNISSAGTAAIGQLITLSTGTIQASPSIIVSSTTPAQYIASGATGVVNATQATYNFVSTSGSSTINELKFAVILGNGSVTNICVGAVCAQPVNGVADLTGLNLLVPVSGGLAQNVQVSYGPVGTYGLASVTTSQIELMYIKFQSGGTTSVSCPATVTPEGNSAVACTSTGTNALTAVVAAPAVSLVGSVPTVTVANTVSTGLILAATNKIGEVTVAASSQGSIRIRTIAFAVGGAGFDGTNTMTIGVGSTPTLRIGSTQVTGSTCTTNNSSTVTCSFDGASYATDFIISAGQSQTFGLYAKVSGQAATSAKASVSTSVTQSTFVWDDTSWNGSVADAAHGVGLLGSSTSPMSIYNWPSNSYTITQ